MLVALRCSVVMLQLKSCVLELAKSQKVELRKTRLVSKLQVHFFLIFTDIST